MTRFNLDETIQIIISHPLYEGLKNVIETIDGMHDHEPVYDHCIKTSKIAREQITGGFITNRIAQEKFSSWMQEDFHGITKGERAVLTALLHDCGKILYFEENGRSRSINVQKENGQTSCPGHEYWGGRLVVPELLKDIPIASEAKRLISEVVKVHGTFGTEYFKGKENWSAQDLIFDMKSRANGYYEESLFNVYCDCHTAPGFQKAKKQIEGVFSDPTFYIKRKYFPPNT